MSFFSIIVVGFWGISNNKNLFSTLMLTSVEQRNNRLRTEVSMAPSVSIMQSKKQIEDIEMAIDACRDNPTGPIEGVRNRQISSGVIVDWKQFQESERVKSQLLVRDGENDEKTIFSYLVEQWLKNEPVKVIYRWIRKPPSNSQEGHTAASTLIEEEHIYRGSMRHYKKNGEGIYIIIKKFADNSQKVKSIKGEWIQDILKSGTMTDESGKEEQISSNVLKLSIRSKKMLTPYLQKNATIERIKEKSMTSNKLIPQASNSGNSISSIVDHHKIK